MEQFCSDVLNDAVGSVSAVFLRALASPTFLLVCMYICNVSTGFCACLQDLLLSCCLDQLLCHF